ncbi:hypothetical protein H6F42_10455 [Pseudanabaena sp. FACHB-1998]|uniref:hypothetical protein n=1 Tax=Pseudanabaena sp. FACHB-1998 TaxID=2692858 RepID=UPI0016811B65|nr:hypothetical protein [Pseudanabaena sp. FACHB-1998]MBD2177331.1 hypothetical protein [Pseudanabaena sp. FACHB-1998]
MNEFWPQDKLILIIGLFQFGLIFFMFMILSLSKRYVSNDHSSQELPTTAIAPNPSAAASKVTNGNNLPTAPNTLTTNAILSANNELAPESNIPTNSSDPDVSNSSSAIPDPNSETVANSEIDSAYNVTIAPELFTELLEISNNPAEMVDEAIRWWLRRRNLESLDTSLDLERRYRVGMRSPNSKRSQQDLWND